MAAVTICSGFTSQFNICQPLGNMGHSAPHSHSGNYVNRLPSFACSFHHPKENLYNHELLRRRALGNRHIACARLPLVRTQSHGCIYLQGMLGDVVCMLKERGTQILLSRVLGELAINSSHDLVQLSTCSLQPQLLLHRNS